MRCPANFGLIIHKPAPFILIFSFAESLSRSPSLFQNVTIDEACSYEPTLEAQVFQAFFLCASRPRRTFIPFPPAPPFSFCLARRDQYGGAQEILEPFASGLTPGRLC